MRPDLESAKLRPSSARETQCGGLAAHDLRDDPREIGGAIPQRGEEDLHLIPRPMAGCCS
jgi:hypothetical protein